jgi:membrane fusion protein (multidrug efflux system)
VFQPPRLAAILLLCLAAPGLAACGKRERNADAAQAAGADSTAVAETKDGDGSDTEPKQDERVPVQIVALENGPMESVLRTAANLEAERSVQVFAEASRRVTELFVEEGVRVAKGQVLAKLQDEEQQSRLGQAKALLDKYERERNHQQSLHERGLTTDKALNDAVSDYDRQRLIVEDAERELAYASVRAPIAGTVTARLIKVGDNVTVGQHLFDIVDFESLVARVYVPEKNLGMLRKGLAARLTAGAIRPEPYLAKVDRVAPIVDARSGTVKVTVAVGGQPGLLPGIFVDVELIVATNPEALRVPKRALIYDNDQIFVYRLKDDGTVERLLVVPQLADQEWIEPASGLASGDRVVIAGQAGLKDGSKVEVVDPNAPAAEPVAEASR